MHLCITYFFDNTVHFPPIIYHFLCLLLDLWTRLQPPVSVHLEIQHASNDFKWYQNNRNFMLILKR